MLSRALPDASKARPRLLWGSALSGFGSLSVAASARSARAAYVARASEWARSREFLLLLKRFFAKYPTTSECRENFDRLCSRKRPCILASRLAKTLRNCRTGYVLNTKCERSRAKRSPTLFRALLKQRLVDQLNLMIAPYLFDGANAPMLAGLSQGFLPASVHCSLIHIRVVSDECF